MRHSPSHEDIQKAHNKPRNLHRNPFSPLLLLRPPPISLFCTQCYVAPSLVFQACLPSKGRQYIHDKSSAPLHRARSHAHPHTPPARRGASAIHIPSSDNQQAPLVIHDKKNGKNTLFSGSPLSSIAAAVLWPLWLKNPAFFHQKKSASPTGITSKALQCVRWHQKAPEGAFRKFKVLP